MFDWKRSRQYIGWVIQVKKHPARYAALYLLALSFLVSCTNPWMDSIVDKLLKEDKPGGGPSGSGMLIFYPSTPAEWTDALAAINGGGSNKNYVIMVPNDLAVPGTTSGSSFPLGSRVAVRGDGSQTISLSTDGSLFRVDDGQTLVIHDVTVEGHAGNNAPVIYAGGTVELNGSAQINSNECTNGGVYVSPTGTLIMKDDSLIINNTAAANGGGVYVDGGSFTMQDRANLSGNKSNNAGYGGGGVYVRNGSFIMEGNASIYGNNAKNDGAGVYLDNSTFIMRGHASIHDNIANAYSNGNDGNGGGVYIHTGSSFTITDHAVIGGNKAIKGGGVFINGGSVTMGGNDPHIENNTATGYGGGVYINGGDFTMSGGTISGNNAPRGGGVHIRNFGHSHSFTKVNGRIYGYNSADPANPQWNQASDSGGTTYGHAAYYAGDPTDDPPGSSYYRDDTLEAADNISTATLPTASGPANSGTTNWIMKP